MSAGNTSAAAIRSCRHGRALSKLFCKGCDRVIWILSFKIRSVFPVDGHPDATHDIQWRENVSGYDNQHINSGYEDVKSICPHISLLKMSIYDNSISLSDDDFSVLRAPDLKKSEDALQSWLNRAQLREKLLQMGIPTAVFDYIIHPHF